MLLDEVQPGMTGVGVTVFEGVAREEFTVHVLGILRNVTGPRRSLILARLEGGPLAETGVIQGMSGSPVYIDGRLVGAVSYALGQFPKEPIAGITPIADMIEAVSLPGARPPVPRMAFEYPISNERFVTMLRHALRPVTAFASDPNDVVGIGLPSARAAQLGAVLRPIAMPLVLGGFAPDAIDVIARAFAGRGLFPILGAGQASDDDAYAEPLQAGDPVAVSLVSGDLLMAGTGTVTMVDEGRVYAFGHPFQSLGPTDFLMNRARVQTLLPSLLASSKLATIGEAIGTFQQDRATAIAGTLGVHPRLIPITVRLHTADGRRPSRTLRFEVVDDQLLTPLLAYVSVFNTLRAYEREAGTATFTVRGTMTVKGHEQVAFEDMFTGNSPSIGAATYVAAPITFLLQNDFEPVELDRLDLDITSAEQAHTATLERVWLDDIRLRPGRTVSLKILTRSYRGEETIQTVPIRIPENASGGLSLLVSGGPQLAQWERQELGRPLEPRSVRQLIRALNDARRNNRLYVKLLSDDAGAVVGGERLASLPPSMLAVYRADRSSGAVGTLSAATLDEWEITTEHTVSGSRTLSLSVPPR